MNKNEILAEVIALASVLISYCVLVVSVLIEDRKFKKQLREFSKHQKELSNR